MKKTHFIAHPLSLRRTAQACLAAALLSSASIAAASQDAAPASSPDWDYIEFSAKSWGAPISAWQLSGLGGGSWTIARREQGAPLDRYALVLHDIEPDEARYRALETILRRLPTPAPNSDECTDFMTDMPYGTIRLTHGATTTEIAWNSGCHDADYVAFMGVLKEADQLVASWGEASPVSSTEEFGQPAS